MLYSAFSVLWPTPYTFKGPTSRENVVLVNVSQMYTISACYYSYLLYSVKSSNFVILFSKNIFFRWTFFRLPNNFFRHWSLYRMYLNNGESHFCLRQCLKVEFLCFHRMTKLDDCHLISSPSQICIVAMMALNRGCECRNHFLKQCIL
jgi:hypothetical protein